MSEKVTVDYEVLSQLNGSIKHIVTQLEDTAQFLSDTGDYVGVPINDYTLSTEISHTSDHWTQRRQTLHNRLLVLQQTIVRVGEEFRNFDDTTSVDLRLPPGSYSGGTDS